jgi:aldehyde dehydrogenase (NAD+)
MSANVQKLFIDGAWVEPLGTSTIDVIDPSTEQPFASVAAGSSADVDRAVRAARAAFPAYSRASKTERLSLLRRMFAEFNARYEEIAQAISREVGAPIRLAREGQAWSGKAHLETIIEALERFEFSERRGTSLISREPIGVCALITPWNWPINQAICKIMPALAAGCAVVLKPSELAPVSVILLAEVMEAAGVPKGVFNLVNGTGGEAGQALAEHPLVDMVSFTGSTRAGILVAKAAADTVKRVTQELGGKSANIILPDADFLKAVADGFAACMNNTGQNCDAPTRMLVPASRCDEALEVACDAAKRLVVGDPRSESTDMGPLTGKAQFEKVQRLIAAGIDEGAQLVTGGLGRPVGLDRGYYVRPTVFGHVKPGMTIEREEIFGPVLSIISYADEADAIRIANDTVYGLAAYVSSRDIDHARAVAAELRAGQINLNYPSWDLFSPFGGFKRSGNGREYADWGISEFLELKAVIGYGQ